MSEALALQPVHEVMPVDEVHPDVMAFLGAIDDLVDEYNATYDERPDRRGDDEIMRMVSGVYDQASVYYSAELTAAVSMLDMVTKRMMEHACQHSQLNEMLEQNGLLPVEDDMATKTQDYEQDEDDEAEPLGKKTSRPTKKKKNHKRAEKRVARFSWLQILLSKN